VSQSTQLPKTVMSAVGLLVIVIEAVVGVAFWKALASFTSNHTAVTVAAGMFMFGIVVRALLRRVARRAVRDDPSNAPLEIQAEVQLLAGFAGVQVEKVQVTGHLKLFEADTAAKRAARNNAMYYATGNRRGVIVLGADIAVSGHTRAVIGHELGHGYHNHHRSRIVAQELRSAVRCGAVAALLPFGFLAAVGLFAASRFGSQLALAANQRRTERQADTFACQLVGSPATAELFEWFDDRGMGVNQPGPLDELFGSHPHSARRAASARAFG
jgi:Zn-dependent protease with chaperone function